MQNKAKETMTPKDKVTELMQKFYYFNTDGETPQPFTKQEAKEISLFICEQVIEQEKIWKKATAINGGHFWIEVKKELQKL